MRDYQKEPAQHRVSRTSSSRFAESHADEFYEWHEDFVIKGNNDQDKEKTAARSST